MNNEYKAILYENYKGVQSHHHMPQENRAAQFAPFAALTGYEEAIQEAMRKTEEKIELAENELSSLDTALALLRGVKHPLVKLTFFQEDALKDGGHYQTLTTSLQKVDYERQILILENRQIIAFENIKEIELVDKEER